MSKAKQGTTTRRRSIELRGLRLMAEKHIALIDAHAKPNKKAQKVRRDMQRLLRDIRKSCGPNSRSR